MNLTKRQKILLGVFLVGLVGLVADRTILRPAGGPQAASAESSTPASKAAVRSGSAPADGNPPTRAPLAERLNKLLPGKGDDSGTRRDPFSLPASWSGNSAVGKEKVPDMFETFARKHQLQAVAVQGQDVGAQVDDNFVILGGAIDGFTLVSVDYRSAVFEREGKQVVLALAGK